MSCGCKSTNKQENRNEESVKYVQSISLNNKGTLIVKYLFKLIGFMIALLTVPFIVLIIIWFMFDLIVLNKEIDIAKITNALVTRIKPFNEGFGDYDYDDDYNDNEEEYIYESQFVDNVIDKEK